MLQAKERTRKRSTLAYFSLYITTSAWSIILLHCTATIIVIGNHIITAIIPTLKGAKWLLKAIRFEKYVLKLKIEHVPMCTCSRFHNKSKQLEYLWWYLMCLVDWVYLLGILNSHYLFVCLHKYSNMKDIGLQVCGRVLGLLQLHDVGLSPALGTTARVSRWSTDLTKWRM